MSSVLPCKMLLVIFPSLTLRDLMTIKLPINSIIDKYLLKEKRNKDKFHIILFLMYSTYIHYATMLSFYAFVNIVCDL
jgi:hypothetical protein